MSRTRNWYVAIAAITICSVATTGVAQDLMITGVLDGTLTGGEPKVVELYAINAVADLSQYAVSRASNGAAEYDVIDAAYILPNVTLSAGDFYYAVGNSFVDQTPNFDLVYPSKTEIRARNSGANSNGDDVTGLFFSATNDFANDSVQIDVVGELGVDGTGTDWEHLDSYLYSNNNRTPSTVFDVADWMVPGINLLDGLTATEIGEAFPAMTFTVGGGPIKGDYDDSGQVGQGDLDLVLLAWGQTAPPVPAGWINDQPTGLIGQGSLDMVLLNWGNTSLAGATAVPEPTTLVLFGLAMTLRLGYCRR